MTVVHLVPALEQGGVERVVCDLNRALVRAGRRSVVISRGGRLVARVCAEGGTHVALDLKSKNPLTALTRAWRLRKALRAQAGAEGRCGAKPERILVCAHSRVPAWLFVLARRLDSLLGPFCRPTLPSFPFITYAHGANSVSRYSAVMTTGDRVIVPSQFLADYLMANYGEGLVGRIRVIRPAVDLARFDPANLDGDFVAAKRREWGLRPGDRVVMAIGRLTPVKGFDHLIRDLAGRLDITPDAGWGDALRAPRTKLVIVGEADRDKAAYARGLKDLAASLGVADCVVFAGGQTKVPECLSLADLVVSGNVTKPESFGLSVAEALAMDKPVRLLRRFGGAAEILEGVAAARRPTLREAVRALCDPDRALRGTLTAYDEACDVKAL